MRSVVLQFLVSDAIPANSYSTLPALEKVEDNCQDWEEDAEGNK